MGQVLAKNVAIPGARWSFDRDDGAFFDIPVQFEITDPGHTRRYKVADRLRQDGGTAIGDGTFRPRQLVMKYGHYSAIDSVWRDSLNQLEAFFRDDERPFFLVDQNNSIRAEVVPVRNSIGSPAGLDKKFTNTAGMVFEMVDPLWESINEIVRPTGTGSTAEGTGVTGVEGTTGGDSGFILQNGTEITLTNNSLFDVFPVFTFIAQADIVKFIWENLTLGGGFEFESNDFVSGTTLIVSSVDGTIELEGAEKSASINQGGFITLVPGDNNLRYESDNGNCIVQTTWRNRFAH